MKAAVCVETNSPLVIEDIPIPEPRDGEVLVHNTACGVCHTDLHVMKAEVAFPLPGVLGHEISGVVAEVGRGVTHVRPGDRVVGSFIMPCGACENCARGMEDICSTFFEFNRLRGTLYDGETRLRRASGEPLSMYSMGGLAEYSVTPATSVFAVPDSLDLETSAILGCSLFTAYGAVANVGEVRAGESVAVIAVGGVGQNIVQLAALSGAESVIAIDVGADKLELARRMGATHTVNSREDDVAGAVAEITGGRGVDVAFEALGSAATTRQAVEITREGGRAVVVGIPPAGTTLDVDLARIVRRKIQIKGSYGARARHDVPALLRLLAAGKLDLGGVISRRVSLDEAPATYESLDRGEILGRAVVLTGG
ncbi:zinc-binding dehydrogenase [Dietzia sp. 179-F 9C3 NHS]|uniref:zinc-binding dehydrogenase n=1 Tax=Dietzia sp. 179-F 9C3 NHS TaxID=3374295 RepID=UPI0038798B8B